MGGETDWRDSREAASSAGKPASSNLIAVSTSPALTEPNEIESIANSWEWEE